MSATNGFNLMSRIVFDKRLTVFAGNPRSQLLRFIPPLAQFAWTNSPKKAKNPCPYFLFVVILFMNRVSRRGSEPIQVVPSAGEKSEVKTSSHQKEKSSLVSVLRSMESTT